MQIKPFKLERYFAKYEFSSKYLLSSSDCDGFSMNDILSFASKEELELWQNLKLGYTESQGLPMLREEISTMYQKITADQVLVLTPEEGIFIGLNCILSKEDHVICIAPSYQSLHQVVESIGCKITYWLPDEQHGWCFNSDELEKMVLPNTKLIIINFPHNPTGYLPPKDDFLQVVEIARKNNLFLFSDEMYRFLEYDSTLTLPSASDLYSNTVSLFGLSKTFGLAGLRLGWLTTQNKDLMEKMLAFKDYTTICSSAPSEILGLIALRHRDIIIDINIRKIISNLKLLDSFVENHSSLISLTRPKAGTIVFPKINIKESSYSFCEKLVTETGIMAVPGEVFDYGDKHIRIGLGRSNFSAVLKKFDDYITRNHFF
ncbi:MAG: aminotransferase class I/II-fold pyridoxal phosphate-dependent enzyme [Tenuifilaceae bacterium]